MRNKALLLGSVSLSAMGASLAPAAAQGPVVVPDSFLYSVEGAWLTGKNTVAEDKLGQDVSHASGGGLTLQDNMGLRGAIMLGTRIDPLWDAQAGVSVNHQIDSVSTASGFYGSGGGFAEQFTTNFSFETLDFNVGYSPALDNNFDVRLFAGIRGLHYTDTQDKLGTQSGGAPYSGYASQYSAEFIGAGPRIGVEASTRFDGSPFGLSGLVAGAAVFGTERSTFATQVSSGGSSIDGPSDTTEEWKSVYDLEAALGLDYYMNDKAKMTFGYRLENITNVGSGSGGLGGGTITSRLSHGAFIKLSGSL